MSEIIYNPETHYLITGTYKTADGIEKQYYTTIKKKLSCNPNGRPEKLPSTDTDTLKKLRDLGLSWAKIGKKLNISAYHAKKIYAMEIKASKDKISESAES